MLCKSNNYCKHHFKLKEYRTTNNCLLSQVLMVARKVRWLIVQWLSQIYEKRKHEKWNREDTIIPRQWRFLKSKGWVQIPPEQPRKNDFICGIRSQRYAQRSLLDIVLTQQSLLLLLTVSAPTAFRTPTFPPGRGKPSLANLSWAASAFFCWQQ